MHPRRVTLIVVALLLAGLLTAVLLRPARRARVHLERGRLFLDMGRHESALTELERSVRLAPPGHRAQFLMGRAYAERGDIDRALEIWLALRDTPLAAEALGASARWALDAGRVQDADALCATAEGAGVPEGALAMTRAEIAVARGRLPEALQQFHRAREAGTLEAVATMRLTEALESAGAAPEAGTVARLAWDAGIRDAGLAVLLGKAAQAEGRLPEALGWFEQAKAANPTSPLVRVGVMQTAIALEDWERAVLEAQDAVHSADVAPFAQLVLGQAAFREARLADAESAFAAATAALPDDPMPSAWLARTRLHLGDVEGGLAGLRRAVAQAPGDAALRLELLRVLWEHGRVPEAQGVAAGFSEPPRTEEGRALIAAARSVPSEDDGRTAATLLEQAEGALAAGDLARARAFALGSLHAAGDRVEPFLLLSTVAHRQGDVRFALGYVEEVLRREPSHAKAIAARARILRDAGQTEIAAAEVERALRQLESGAPLLVSLALELWEETQSPARIVALIEGRDAATLAPTDRLRYARALLARGDPERASRAVAALGTPEAQLVEIRALLALRRDRQAAEIYQRLSAAPSTQEALAVLGYCLGRQGDRGGNGPPVQKPRTMPSLAAQACAAMPVRGDEGPDAAWRCVVLAAMEAGEWASANATLSAAAPWAAPVDAASALPGDALAYRRALAADLMGWPEVAARYFEDARMPQLSLWCEPYAFVLERLGRVDEALAVTKAALAGGPGSAGLWFLRARLEVARAGPAEAWPTVQAGIRHHPDSAPLLGLAGHLAQDRGETAVALGYYRDAARLGAPPLVLNNLAWLLLAEGTQLTEAVQWSRAAHDAQPYSPPVLDTLARSLRAVGQHEEALYYANVSALLRPGDPEAHLLRVGLLLDTRRIALARQELERLLSSADANFAARPDVRTYVKRLEPSVAAAS